MDTNYLLVVDVEATCDQDRRIPRHDMEIIEIGAVLLDQNYEVVDEFQTFIRPTVNSILTPFCTELTSIQQEDVDDAPETQEAFARLQAWLDQYQSAAWCSWGGFDRKQFKRDCLRTAAPCPLPEQHINARKQFIAATGGDFISPKEAIESLGLSWEGTHHRGIDDARNIARILKSINA